MAEPKAEDLIYDWNLKGDVPDYGSMRIDDPCVRSELRSVIIEVTCGGARAVRHSPSAARPVASRT